MTLTAGAALAAAERAAPLIDCLASHGFAVAETFFDRDLCRLLEVETAALATDPTAIDAGVGREGGHVTDPSIRRARIRWLDGQTAAQKHFLAEAEYLRTAINQALFLGLFSFEAQFALTPSGGFYARHVDSFSGRRNRIVLFAGHEGGPLTQMGDTEQAPFSPIYVGLGVCAHDDKAEATAIFSDVTVEALPAPPPAAKKQ